MAILDEARPILPSLATTISIRRPARSLRTIAIVIVVLLLLLLRIEWAYFGPRLTSSVATDGRDDKTLPARMLAAEKVYQDTLVGRKELIERAGPGAFHVDAFPRDLKLHTLWDFFPATFRCPHLVERIGHLGVGGKWVCGIDRLAQKKDCVIYSFGSSWDSSFEASILRRTKHCKIYGFHDDGSKFGPEVRSIDRLGWRTRFTKYGLHSVDELPRHRSLASIMFENGHDFVDLIKIDLEGWEFAALSPLFEAYTSLPLPFGQLQLEIHASGMPFDKVLEWWQLLEGAGLRPFFTEPNMVYVNLNRGLPDIADYSFINIRGDNVFISNSDPTLASKPP